MPKTLGQSIVFTAITAWMMVFGMTVYNTALAVGRFTNATFLVALKNMWIEYLIIFLLAFFVSSRLAKHFAFKIITSADRGIFVILMIQVFTVIFQVAFASIIGVWHSGGFNINFIPNYLTVYCKNFIMAFALQLIIVGLLSRKIFRTIFLSGKTQALENAG